MEFIFFIVKFSLTEFQFSMALTYRKALSHMALEFVTKQKQFSLKEKATNLLGSG